MKWKVPWLAVLMAGDVASGAVVLTGAVSGPSDLQSVVNEFRTLVSGGGVNNGVGGSGLANGRREVAWDAASLDPVQVPSAFPGTFFNTNSLRGLVLSTTGSLRVSGRAASGSTDTLFSTLNPGAAEALQSFSPERLLAVYGATTVEATFFMPSSPSQRALVRGFGAVFADVGLAGASRLEAFGRSGQRLASVVVPASAGGLSFAGVWMDEGEWIDSIRLTTGQTGIEDGSGALDVVALDDFIYAEPQLVPEPEAAFLLLAWAMVLPMGRRRAGR